MEMDNTITIIGMGHVGSTLANMLLPRGMSINIVDVDYNKLISEYYDLRDANEIMEYDSELTYSNKVNKHSEIYVICAGCSCKLNQGRMELFESNSFIVEKILDDIVNYNDDAWIIIATNPSHELAKLCFNKFRKVIAIGKDLDKIRTIVTGRHEKPEYDNHYDIIKNGKGYTNFGVCAEIMKMIRQLHI